MTSPLDGLAAGPCPDTATPETGGLANPPGLPALAYRVDTRDGFLARLLGRLSTETVPDGPFAGSRPLAGLEAGEAADPAVALLDAWAVAGDILAFYQERIANEGYLRTAVERRSVLELARLVGQGLGPGVAAGALLAFTVDDAPGSPASVLVPRGTQVQSIPGQGELPQTFETAEELVARAELSAMVPRRSKPQELAGARELYLAGAGLRLSAGDVLLLVTPETSETWTGRVDAVEPDTGRDLTRVRLEAPVDLGGPDRDAADVFVLRERAAFFGHNAPRWGSLPKSDVVRDDPYAAEASNWDEGRTIWTDSQRVPYFEGGDPDAPAGGVPAVYLDRDVESAAAGTWAVFTGQDLTAGTLPPAVYRITGRTAGSRADYAVQGPSTGLALAAAGGAVLPAADARPAFDLRRATAYVASELLARAEQPITAPLPDAAEDGGLTELTLDAGVTGLRAGRPVVVRGTTTTGATVSRVLLLQQVDAGDPAHTRLAFQQPLLPAVDDPAVRFVRSTVTLHANVALATHGETVEEVLGSGDSNLPGQRFLLSRPPLTQLSAPLPGGRQSSLAVRVGNVLWQEVENLATEGPESRSYMVEIGDDGRTAVRFGDGVHGARLPTGQQNVTAVYRSGLGLPGMVGAGAIQLFLTRPLGIREVTNPLPAAGGAAPDGVAQARDNAPVASRTLGRIVSFSDFEDFARSFAGIAKVQAAPIAGIHLTVAGEQGAAVDPGSALYRNLLQALGAARLPGPPVSLASYQPVPFRVQAHIVLDPRYRADDVFARVEQALLSTFSFDRRELGQPLLASDVLRVVQGVPGVVAVDLEALHRAGAPVTLEPSLTARPARLVAGRVLPAQLLLLEAGGAILRGRTS